ncbi:MAG: fused response regulator/phosphatase [Spongiibacteraceae bacterium]
MPDRLRVLVADDASHLRVLLRELIGTLGHAVIEAADGLEAVAQFRLHAPDIVLMDMLMPGLDGLGATAEIRKLCGERWVPIIMISADDEQSTLVNALDAGCDDYLLKPVNPQILAAKIRAFQRVADMQSEVDRQREELRGYRDYAEEELSLTEHIMARLVRRDAQLHPRLQVWSEAVRGASGDIVLSAQSENGVTYLMLADATGHGLSAAVTLIPVTNVFYAMASKGFNVSTIVEEMNRQVRSFCPVERFVALTLVAVRPQADVIEVWNGGTPPVIVFDGYGAILRSFKSRHLPLGILDAGRFSSSTEFLRYNQDLQLALFSDGLIEAGRREQYGLDRLREVLALTPMPQRLARLQQDFYTFLGAEKPHDDVTFTLLNCPRDMAVEREVSGDQERSAILEQSDWHLDALLSAEQLKQVDVVPMVAEWSHKMGLSREIGGNFFIVLTELFVNALDHGILELPSAIKEQPDGFEHYFQLRQERLDNLAAGEIHIVVKQLRIDGEGLLTIRLRDSGGGFTFGARSAIELEANSARSGRGIGLVRKLCRRIEYIGNGNEVYAEISI